ncbi:COX15/CtaA family protein [Georgenia alba]|uniref:Heme A synthase n=1 Tax=Georgenia alba TaxID=2233858 RepID=A0ABW2QCE5_9MICO
MSTTAGPRPGLPTAGAGEGARPAGPGDRADRVTSGLAVANLVAQLAIIATGGAVRLTGSGLGCSTWPMCEPGSFTPVFHEATSIHPYVEFGNRTMTGVLSVVALALIWALYRREPVRHRRVRHLGWAVLAGIGLQAVVGGMSVWYDLHPAIVGSHMLFSLGLVAVSAYLLVRLRRPDAPAEPLLDGAARALPWLLAAVSLAVVVLGTVVTGAGPHSGDAEVGYRYAVDPAAAARWHGASVWLFLAVLAVLGVRLLRTRDRTLATARKGWWLLLAATLANGAIGYVQYLTGLPELLVGLHMVGAGLVVAAATLTCSGLYVRRP